MTTTIVLCGLLAAVVFAAAVLCVLLPEFRRQQARLAIARAALDRIAADPHDMAILATNGSTDSALQWAGAIARAALAGERPPPPINGTVRLEVAPHCERAALLLMEMARTGAADHLASRDRLEVNMRVIAPPVLNHDQSVDAIATAKGAEAEVRALLSAAAGQDGLQFGGQMVRDYAVTWVGLRARPGILLALMFEEAVIPRAQRAAVEEEIRAALTATPAVTLEGFSLTSMTMRWAQDEAAADVPRQLRAIARQLYEIAIQALQERGRRESIRQRRPALEVARAERLLIEKISTLSARAAELDD